MKTFSHTASAAARLVFAAGALATTLVLFSAFTAISEPQRSVLMAKTQHSQPAQPTVLAMAAPAAKTSR